MQHPHRRRLRRTAVATAAVLAVFMLGVAQPAHGASTATRAPSEDSDADTGATVELRRTPGRQYPTTRRHPPVHQTLGPPTGTDPRPSEPGSGPGSPATPDPPGGSHDPTGPATPSPTPATTPPPATAGPGETAKPSPSTRRPAAAGRSGTRPPRPAQPVGLAAPTPAPTPAPLPAPVQAVQVPGPDRIPAEGSTPYVASPAAVPIAAGRVGPEWSLLAGPGAGTKIFMVGLAGLVVAIVGLVTVAVRRRQW